MDTPRRHDPGPGQESVWDYPRPPRLEPSSRRVEVSVDGIVIADTTRAFRVLETYHPPSWYLPPDDVDPGVLRPVDGASFCEWKGVASYFDVAVGSQRIVRAAWAYPQPSAAFAAIRDHVAFYPALVECRVDGERVEPQPGVFYGGWVTSDVSGPFKGSPGMDGW
jgi:uncharacterized protein (DUF427 family)